MVRKLRGYTNDETPVEGSTSVTLVWFKNTGILSRTVYHARYTLRSNSVV
jgi:hypothetical protein